MESKIAPSFWAASERKCAARDGGSAILWFPADADTLIEYLQNIQNELGC
jgi:hypothetical protein